MGVHLSATCTFFPFLTLFTTMSIILPPQGSLVASTTTDGDNTFVCVGTMRGRRLLATPEYCYERELLAHPDTHRVPTRGGRPCHHMLQVFAQPRLELLARVTKARATTYHPLYCSSLSFPLPLSSPFLPLFSFSSFSFQLGSKSKIQTL